MTAILFLQIIGINIGMNVVVYCFVKGWVTFYKPKKNKAISSTPEPFNFPSAKEFNTYGKEDISRLILEYAMFLLQPIDHDPNGISADGQQLIIKRCGEAIQIAGSYKDRTEEQIIDAYNYLLELSVEFSHN